MLGDARAPGSGEDLRDQLEFVGHLAKYAAGGSIVTIVRMGGMRYLAGIGAVVFAYLTLIPVALIGSTLDPACAGQQCETGLLSDIVFTTLYVGCAAGTLSVSATLSLYLFRPSSDGEDWIVRALIGAAIVIGLTFYALFAIAIPIPAIVITLIGSGVYLLLRRNRDAHKRPDPGSNGKHPELNGSGRLNGHAKS